MIPLDTAPSIFSVNGVVGVVFLINIGVTLAGGVAVAFSKKVINAVAGLIVCFVGVAGLYFFLNSIFVSMMQILIYVGAVAITISFAVMLAAPEEKLESTRRGVIAGPPGIISAILLCISFSALSVGYTWQPMERINDGSMKSIGVELLTNYSMVFELISIVLLIAILGALVIARTRREDA